MSIKKVLIFYISVNSGHQMAAMAIEDSIRIIDRGVETLNINYFQYTNPVLSSVIMKTYHGMLKRTPEIWDYLYDNPGVKEKTSNLRGLIQKLNTKKITRLMEWYKPEVIVCTQAFPCVAMAEYKRETKTDIPIIGVVTDYGVHSYWIDDNVDLYIVPSDETKNKLIELGVKETKIDAKGIPVNPRFMLPLDKQKIKAQYGLDNRPVILIMGGSQGMISMDEIVKYMAKLPLDLQLVIICGVNKKLQKILEDLKGKIRFPVKIFGYVNNIEEFMSVSDIIITKPGGLTVTECLIKKVPMVIVNPIPGQEQKNTDFLIRHKAAIKASDARDVARRAGELISNPAELKQIAKRMASLSKPFAGMEIAKKILYWK